MKLLQPVIWSKGTFLTPQHLQAQDRFIESLLRFQLDALEFRPWGFRRLVIDREALAAGTFSVSQAAGIFPDGLLFDIPEADAAPPPRPIIEAFEPGEDKLDVFLAVPSYRERGLNVAAANLEADTRYRSEVVLLRDENSGQSEKPVFMARKNMRILVGPEVREGTDALKAATVFRTSSGALTLDPYFVPPLVDFASSDYLTSILRRLVEILFARSAQLSGMRRQRNQSLADFSAADIANFWLLYTINTSFPVLNHYFLAGKGHPERLYSAMLDLAGALSTFSKEIQPGDLPRYEHDNLSFCFTDLDEKIRHLLETVVPTNCVSIPLKQTQPFFHAASLSDERLLKNTRFYFAINAEISQAEILAKTPNLIKICSSTHIEHLVRQALPGVQLTYTPSPPSAIPVKTNYHYFSLNQTGVQWDSVLRARNLVAYVPEDFANPQMELIVLLPEAS
jgi:type VI secretion system protein ImpJ